MKYKNSKINRFLFNVAGCYTTITLAVYGNLTQVVSDSPGTNQSQAARPSLPREVPPIQTNLPQSQDWNPEPPNPIPTYTGNVAANGTEVYDQGNYAPENYEDPMYRDDYYESDVPKDPRSYHHLEGNDWEKDPREMSVDRDNERIRHSPRLERSIERDRERREGRSRRRSLDRRSRDSSRHRDLDRRSRSRDRDYVIQGEYRPRSRSRSRSIDRMRGISSDRDWDRSSYKKDDYRRHRDSSYDRSRAGSYDKRSGSYDRRASSYDKRAPSYERKIPYEKRSPYDKRGSSYERRAPSYDKQASYDKKRLSPYSRIRGSSYSSRSPSRDDPRKRPRTPPDGRRPISPRDKDGNSPINSSRSDEGIVEYDRNGKPIPRVDFYQGYRHKAPIRSPSQELESVPYIDPQHSSLVTVPIVDNAAAKSANIESPVQNQEDERSLDEAFEPILSDEDICDDLEGPPYIDMEYDINEYCGVDDFIKYYNPLKSEWIQYENVNKIYLLATVRHENTKDVLNASFDELVNVCPELKKIYEMSKAARKRERNFLDFIEIDNVIREEWVHQCEQLCSLICNLTKYTDIMVRIFKESDKNEGNEFSDILKYLITFCKVGLNFDFALSQQLSTNKIRHMKCGIRFAEALVSHKHNAEVIKTLLKSGVNVALQLLELYSKEYMALSIRLLILKALNGCLSSKASVQNYLQDHVFPKFDKTLKENKTKNGYQALISIMQTNPLARIKFSVSSLIKKLNMYELLEKLNEFVLNLNNATAENKETADLELSDSKIEFVINAFDEILYTYRTQCFHMSQPKRFLPAFAQFDINKDCSNDILIEFFKEHQFLDVCLYLLTCPATCSNLVIVSPIYDLIYELVHSHNGLKYLYQNMTASKILFKILMQPYNQQNCDEFIYGHDLNNYNDLQILGLEMAYRLRAMYYLKSISDVQSAKPDENELIDRLQSLFCLSFGNVGKVAVPDVVVMDDNANCLIEILESELRSKSKIDPNSKQKSPAKGYAVDLLISAVKFSANVPFLKRYGLRIMNIVKEHEKFEQNVSSLLQELTPYLKPIENAGLLNGEDLADCVEVLKKNVDAAPSVPGEMVTCLRVLRHYCISDYDTYESFVCDSLTDEYTELKYKYNVLQLFSLDGVVHICAILERLASHFEQPSVHTSLFASIKGLQVAQMIVPCLRLLDDMLARVVKCRGSKFRDLTAIPVLLKTYGLLRAFPVGCVAFGTATRGAEAAVRALLAYAQPAADDAGDGDSIKRGPWTSLCSEVINYIMTAPYTFVSGLLVFSELLPLPLPMQTKIRPTERELSDASNERRLWSAHLHVLGNELVDMIRVICTSTYRPVVHMLRRVCVQIADLAPNTAATVARAAAGAVTRELSASGPATAGAARVLGFLACLVTHAPVKCAVLHAVSSGGAKSGDLFAALCGVFNLSNSSNEHVTAQEYAAHALAGFCDAEVTLTPSNNNVENIIANSLPSKDALAHILEASVNCLESTKACNVASSILRSYFVLTEHEYGFQQFRTVVTKKKESFGKFFKWLMESGAEDTLECLNLYLDLLRILSAEEGEGPIGRKTLLSGVELAQLVGYSPGDTDHPALALEKYLKVNTFINLKMSYSRYYFRINKKVQIFLILCIVTTSKQKVF